MEATVKHLEAVYPYSKYLSVRNAFSIANGGIEDLAGICFFPTRSDEAVVGNYTNGFEIVLVKWTASPAGPISFYGNAEYGGPDNDLKTDLRAIDGLSGWDEFRLYNDSVEFEYAFIDRQTFEYLANSNAFYANGIPSSFQPGFPNRGLLVSRAFITMQGGSAGNNYQRFRALRTAPYPEPPIPTDTAGRASIAYHVASPCPPYWHDNGLSSASTNGGGSGGSLVGPAPVMFSTDQSVNPPDNLDDCNCVINNINKVELHRKLIEQGLVSKEPPPAYKMRLWPWIILALIILLFAIIGLAEIIRGDAIFGFKGD